MPVGNGNNQFVNVCFDRKFYVVSIYVLYYYRTATLEYIDQRMAELQGKLVMCVNKNAEYDVIANEIDALREKKAAAVTGDAEQEM